MSAQKAGRTAVSEHVSRYDGIEGGASPSPFTSIFVVVAFASALGAAAIGESMGETGRQLWDLSAITAVIAVVMAAFASPGE